MGIQITSEYNDSYIKITRDNFLEKYDELLSIIKNSPEFLGLSDRTQLIFDKKENREGKGAVYNRQTHTGYVANISLKLAKKLGFSEQDQKKAELIGWCHDLGHTAFGHTGEKRIDKILQHFKISSEKFSDYYMGYKQGIDERYTESKHAFEHHAHSTRVLRKILKENNIVIEPELFDEIEWGIMCHSESRVAKTKITKPLWTIARYADKFYAFTDIIDIIKAGNRIPVNILETIQKDMKAMARSFPKNPITDKDIEQFRTILDLFYKEDSVKLFQQQYIDEAELDSEYIDGKTAYSINTEENIGRTMRVLKGIAEFMRREGIIGKEEVLADAMVDEIVAYRIAHPSKETLSEEDKVIEACLFITANTDTQLRKYYEYMAIDKDWCESFDAKLNDKNYKGFETPIAQVDRDEIRRNPDIILTYNFDVEVEKVENLQVKMKLYEKIKEYRANPLLPERRNMDTYERRDLYLAERRELIHLIEVAKSGGNPFFKRNIIESDRGDNR